MKIQKVISDHVLSSHNPTRMFLNLQQWKEERISHSNKSKAQFCYWEEQLENLWELIFILLATENLEGVWNITDIIHFYDRIWESMRKLHVSMKIKSWSYQYQEFCLWKERDCEWHQKISWYSWSLMINNCAKWMKNLLTASWVLVVHSNFAIFEGSFGHLRGL